MDIEVLQIGLVLAGVLVLFSDKIPRNFSLNKAQFSGHKEIEESISSLITEAQQAGAGLNEALLERKSELEVLLKRLELKEKLVVEKTEPKEPEFPNESWLKESSKIDAIAEERKDRVSLRTDDRIAASMGFDVAAIKVARRLLLAGQEDFRVARKLNMSVNDIKQLKALFGIKSEVVTPQPVVKNEAIKKYNFNFEEAVNG